VQKASGVFMGLPADVEPTELAQAGWAVVFSADTPEAVRTALEPLLAHRARAEACRIGTRAVILPVVCLSRGPEVLHVHSSARVRRDGPQPALRRPRPSGMDGYVSRPLGRKELLEVIAAALGLGPS
jgi:hypothetical protein